MQYTLYTHTNRFCTYVTKSNLIIPIRKMYILNAIEILDNTSKRRLSLIRPYRVFVTLENRLYNNKTYS